MHRPVLILLTALVVAGCASTPAPTAAPVKLLVRDGAMREVGAECSGTGAYQAIHPKAGFRVQDAGGKRLAEGTLPPGKAVKAIEEQLDVPREPTFCQVEFTAELPAADGYRLLVGDLPPIELARDPSLGERAPLVGLTT
ncbi:hypothetical protein M8C13_17455 [Crossiella sp. SN42]|uniref:hypothetical protein n=1 Tax=Crossiella sp. SN42 TaxID=2944808 RepID=UPI00207C93A3|nr:hypothetical protein [Crossiella sp. SN42]MCO1577548.1 hypothetical protein [Crossiella sp. SN42]